MRVLLANQDPSARSSLGILFKAQSDLEVVGEPSEVSQLASVVGTHHPDVVVVDLDLISGQIETFLKTLQALDHPPAVVGMSIRTEKRQVAMEMGVAAFAYKGDPPDRLLSAIQTAFTQRCESHQE